MLESISHLLGICHDTHSHIDVTDLILSNYQNMLNIQRSIICMTTKITEATTMFLRNINSIK